jgi:hypothetical protein
MTPPCGWLQGIRELAPAVPGGAAATMLLCQLHAHRASARLGLHRPYAALWDALTSVRLRTKFAKGYLRAATCFIKLGELGAARALLDKVC